MRFLSPGQKETTVRRKRYAGSGNDGTGLCTAGSERNDSPPLRLSGAEGGAVLLSQRHDSGLHEAGLRLWGAIEAYGVWQEKKLYGRTTMGVVRTTYLIDEAGIIQKAMGKVKAADNPGEMLGLVGGEGAQ